MSKTLKYALRLLVLHRHQGLVASHQRSYGGFKCLINLVNLLMRLGQCDLEIGEYRDSDGNVRALWSHFPRGMISFGLRLMRSFCGATSVQVMRRMNAPAMIWLAVPMSQALLVLGWTMKATIAYLFVDGEARLEALKEDRQGLKYNVPRPADRGIDEREFVVFGRSFEQSLDLGPARLLRDAAGHIVMPEEQECAGRSAAARPGRRKLG